MNKIIKLVVLLFFFQILNSFAEDDRRGDNKIIKLKRHIKNPQNKNNKIKKVLRTDHKNENSESKDSDIISLLGLERTIKSDSMIINQIFHHAKRHEWHLINREIKHERNHYIQNFINLIKYSNCKKNHDLLFDESDMFDFLSERYRILNDNLIISNLRKSTLNSLTQRNENNINSSTISALPSSIISRYKRNRSLIHDQSFVLTVKKIWHTKKFNSEQSEYHFFETFRRVLNKGDMDIRFENMLWDGNFSAASRILRQISNSKRNQMQNRIRILRASNFNEINVLLNNLKKRNSSEFQTAVFDAIRWCDNQKMKQRKFELIKDSVNFKTFNKYWHKLFKETRRELISSKDQRFIELAYYLSKFHGEKPKTTDFVEAEFLAGFIAFNFLKDYKKAIEHFSLSYRNASNENRVSRGAYWIGLSLKKINSQKIFENSQFNNPNYWFSLGARNFTSFYGQLCAFEIDGSNPIKKYLAKIDSDSIQNVKNHPLFYYYYYSLLSRNLNLSSKIAKIFTLSVKRKSEIGVLAKLANQLNMPLVSIQIGNLAQKHLNMTILEALYPTPRYNNLKYDKALVYAIIHKESAFDNNVVSHAGALGLMQLMPETASKISKQIGIHSPNHKNFFDPNLNTLLGSQYIKNLQGRFNGFSLLSIGAYNAGENAVDRWIDSNGDPRNSRNHYDVVSWIEGTTFKETRNYMQGVMANYLIYQTILNNNKNYNLGKMLFY